MDTLTKLQYSAISERSSVKGTPEAIRDWLMSSRPASPASPSASLESKPENQIPETSGPKRLSASAWFDPDSYCWRTYQVSWLTGTFSKFSETWPRAGMIVDGKLFRRLKWERRINEIGSGYWPTARAIDGIVRHSKNWMKKRVDENRDVDLTTAVKMWPTPQKHDSTKGNADRVGRYGTEHGGRNLNDEVQMWPTPQTRDYRSERGTYEFAEKRKAHGRGLSLPFKVTWPTPDVHQGHHGGQSYMGAVRRMEKGKQLELRDKVLIERGSGGQLNPNWVCWLMGWPIGVDSLEPIPDLLWLDWEIDPADMEEAETYPTISAADRTHITPGGHPYWGGAAARKKWKGIQERRSNADPIPRVATGIKDRVNRLKALGNGMVPQCMAAAWNILIGDWKENEI